MAWSPALEAKYVRKGSGQLTTMNNNEASCEWYYTIGSIRVGVIAGTDETRQFPTLKREAKVQLGISLRSHEQSSARYYRLKAWSEDPPYAISVIVDGPTPESKATAVELVKDLAAHLTRERLARRTAQIVTLYREKRGERARKFLDAWPSVKAAFDHVAPLAPGFPRLARGTEFRGDPGKSPASDDTFVLLGVCPPPAGEQLHIIASFLVPYIETGTAELFIVDAEALTIDCPTFTGHELSKPGDYNELPDGLVFSQGFSLSGAPDPIGLRGAAILRDKDFNVLDVALYEIPRPLELENVQGRYQSIARRTVLPDCAGYAETLEARYFCPVRWSDLLCRGALEASGGKVTFDITADEKIQVRHHELTQPGASCTAPE